MLGAILFSVQAAADGRVGSVYTDLAGSSCRAVEKNEEHASSISRCPGLGGYQIERYDYEHTALSVSYRGREVSH